MMHLAIKRRPMMRRRPAADSMIMTAVPFFPLMIVIDGASLYLFWVIVLWL